MKELRLIVHLRKKGLLLLWLLTPTYSDFKYDCFFYFFNGIIWLLLLMPLWIISVGPTKFYRIVVSVIFLHYIPGMNWIILHFEIVIINIIDQGLLSSVLLLKMNSWAASFNQYSVLLSYFNSVFNKSVIQGTCL